MDRRCETSLRSRCAPDELGTAAYVRVTRWKISTGRVVRALNTRWGTGLVRLRPQTKKRPGYLPSRFQAAEKRLACGCFLGRVDRGRGAGVLLDPGLDRGRPAGVADQAVDQLPAPEETEGGDAHHAVFDCDVLVDVHVQLADRHLAGVLASHLLHHPPHHPPAPAPVGVKVDDNWFACIEHVG